MGLLEAPGYYEKLNGGGPVSQEQFHEYSSTLFWAGTQHFYVGNEVVHLAVLPTLQQLCFMVLALSYVQCATHAYILKIGTLKKLE